MTKYQTILPVLNTIQHTINDVEFKHTHKTSDKAFLRDRKLTFADIMCFVLGLNATTLDFEVLNFCSASKVGSISTAAVCKARDKVNYTAFRELLTLINKSQPAPKKFHGDKVIAIDGMQGELPNVPELKQKYLATKAD